MDTRCVLMLSALLLLLVVGLTEGVTSTAQKKKIAAYEEALSVQLAKLKKKGKHGNSEHAMTEAMQSAEHLKPKDLPIEETIAMMGRLFQKEMGLNINIKNPDDFEREAKLLDAEKETKAEKKKTKKPKKKKKTGPSMTHSDELKTKKPKKKKKTGPSMTHSDEL